MYKNLLLKPCVCVLLFLQFRQCFSTPIIINLGVIVEYNDNTTVPVIEEAMNTIESDIDKRLQLKIISKKVNFNNESELDRSIYSLLKSDVHAVFTKPNIFGYQILQSYSETYQLPLIIPSLPEVFPDLFSPYVISMQPQTSKVVINLLELYKWKTIFYLYDNDNGLGKLQKIFQLDYQRHRIKLAGLFKVSNANQANEYLRKLQISKKHGKFYVIIDTDSSLAKDILVNHAHDAHLGKKNYRFLIANPVLEDFWKTAEFVNISIIGFITLTQNMGFPDNLKLHQHHQRYRELNYPLSAYFFYDAALLLVTIIKKLTSVILHDPDLVFVRRPWFDKEVSSEKNLHEQIMRYSPRRHLFFHYIIAIKPDFPITGIIRFDEQTHVRKDFAITVIETSPEGYKEIGNYASVKSKFSSVLPTRLSELENGRKKFKVISMLSPPFLMLHSADNGTKLEGNDRFKGFSKDLTEILAERLKFDYEIVLPDDGMYGDYDESKGQWTGIIGEIIRGKADIAITDLQITPSWQKVVDFLNEPICSTSLSIIMKDPRSLSLTASTSFYLFSSFSAGVWVCIVIIAIITITLFHVMLSFSGSYESIEANSDTRDEKFAIINSVWYICGSSMMYNTGIYPRSIPCRVVSGTWWCFISVCLAFFIANTASRFYVDHTYIEHHPQLSRLLSLSVESIIKESVQNNWPHLGIIRNGSTHKFIQKSRLPVYTSLAEYLKYYSNYVVDDINSGLQKVRDFAGDYAFIVESIKSDYYSNDGPCDTISIHDSMPYAEYGIAVPFGSSIRYDLNNALKSINKNGELGHLYKKWWVDELKCEPKNLKNYNNQNLATLSEIFYIILIGLLIGGLICISQYFWKKYKGEDGRRRLSTERVVMSWNSSSPERLINTSMDEDNGTNGEESERELFSI